jgi:hypothetical protein
VLLYLLTAAIARTAGLGLRLKRALESSAIPLFLSLSVFSGREWFRTGF